MISAEDSPMSVVHEELIVKWFSNAGLPHVRRYVKGRMAVLEANIAAKRINRDRHPNDTEDEDVARAIKLNHFLEVLTEIETTPHFLETKITIV